jgi:hypothetical protein
MGMISEEISEAHLKAYCLLVDGSGFGCINKKGACPRSANEMHGAELQVVKNGHDAKDSLPTQRCRVVSV